MTGAEARVLYWSGAFLNILVLAGLAFAGVAEMRRRHGVRRHRRLMLGAAALVGLFLTSYLVKLALLGRESPETWDSSFRYTLWFHESCVFLMLLAGGTALLLAWRQRFLRLASDPEWRPSPRVLRLHRRAGWTALVSCTLAIASAGVTLAGMVLRLP